MAAKKSRRARGGGAAGARDPPAGGGFAYSLEEGTAAVRGARATVDAAVRQEPSAPALQLPERFKERAGVFTTLTVHPLGELRGCVGFAEPILPLAQAIPASAAAAALEDGRFSPVEPSELGSLVVDVSLLTRPEPLRGQDPAAIVGAVEVGRHGLIVRDGNRGGLLLPQVAVEWAWSAEEFLEHTCAKAGREPEFWRSDGARLFTFQAEVFGEESPRGAVARRAHGGPGREAPTEG